MQSKDLMSTGSLALAPIASTAARVGSAWLSVSAHGGSRHGARM